MRLLLGYSRENAAKYVSHLDMQALFMRALRRAKIDVLYSSGFNPHILMSFASPLSVGYATKADYLEVRVAQHVCANGAKEALNAALPQDIRVNTSFFIAKSAPKLAAIICQSDYLIKLKFINAPLSDKIQSGLLSILSGQTCEVTDKKGRQINIAPLVKSAELNKDELFCTLVNNNPTSLNPAVLVTALAHAANQSISADICRIECYAEIGGSIMPLAGLAEKWAPESEE